MATDIEVCNSALAKIRGRFINSFNDNSTEARLLKVLFPLVRDRLLREVAPNCARKQYELASIVETPLFNFTYVFAIPSDVIKILETDRYFDQDWRQQDGKIYANDSTFFIDAIYRLTDCSKFDSVFAEAFAYSLAAELATPLTNSTKLAADMREAAETLCRRSRTYSSQERGSIEQPEATDWLTSRF